MYKALNYKWEIPNISHEKKRKREKEDGLYLSLSPPVLPISVNIQSTPEVSTVRLPQDVNSPSTPGCQQPVYTRVIKGSLGFSSAPGHYTSAPSSRSTYQTTPSVLPRLWGTISELPIELLIKRLPRLPSAPGHYTSAPSSRSPYQAAPSASLGSGALYQCSLQ